MHVLHKFMSLFIQILMLSIILALLYTCIKAVMLSVCHSSSKVIEAVYFILFEMANEGAGASLDVDRAVSEAVTRAMSTITDSICSVIDTRLQAFKQDNSQTVEAAVRRAKHDRYEFKSRGNK